MATSEPTDAVRVEPLIRSVRTAWILYGVLSFVVFVLLTFPVELLLQRVVTTVEQSSALRMRYSTGEWSWAQGWTLQNLSIERSGMTLLRISRLTLSPSFFGLLYGQPFPLTYSAKLYGGTANGTLRREEAAWRAHFSVNQLALEQWPFPAPWGQGRITGHLTLDGAVQGTPDDVASWSGNITAVVEEGSLKAGNITKFPLPALQTAKARARATLKSGRLEVSDLALEADGVEAHLQGAISLRLPLEWSAIDLQLTTRQTGTPPPSLATLVSLLPAAPGAQGERRASLTGTFAAPVVRSLGAAN
jgi:type II secretion system protein N